MTTATFKTTGLPWSKSKDQLLFKWILLSLLGLCIALGVLIPNVQLPEIKREKLEKIPPQLAKVIKRTKEAPKPVVNLPPKPETIIEKKPEIKKEILKKEVVKPTPVAEPVVPPRPKPKPISQKDRTPEKVRAAKEKAKKLMSGAAVELADMQSLVNIEELALDSAQLTNDGKQRTDSGTVVDEKAVAHIANIDEAKLTRQTGGAQLAEATRETTKVKALPKDKLSTPPEKTETKKLARSQMQIRRVFEKSKSRFDRIYRRALRENPALEGTVMLGVKVAPSGEVASCEVASSDLNDKKVERKLISTCRMLSFAPSDKSDEFEWPLAFSPQ